MTGKSAVQTLKLHIVALIGIGFVLAFIPGCENSFDPRGPYQKQMVVYSVLSNNSDSQYVRVFTTYNPTGFDPSEVTTDTYVRKALVTLADDSTSYKLRDTTIVRVDKSRYADDIGAYIAYPCRTRLGKTYTLSVASGEGNISATVSIPGAGFLIPNNSYILKAPDKYGQENINVTIKISSITRGYVARIYVDYLARVGGSWVHKRDEVPTGISSVTGQTVVYDYPKLIRRLNDIAQPWLTLDFPISVYQSYFAGLQTQYGVEGFQMISATYMLTQVEANLYKYYNLANGFQDAYSIRTDQPDFSNIQGGLGVFGAMTVDSVRVDL
jgi:hypothetical protein